MAGANTLESARDNEGIVIWGHSMPADITPARLQAALRAVGAANPERPIVNAAVGGSGTFNSLLRQGAIAWTTEVAGGAIPAEGRVELANHRSPALEQQLGPRADELMKEIRWHRISNTWVEIGGVVGRLGWNEGAPPFFERREPGNAVQVDNPVAVRMLAVGPDMAHDLETLNRYLSILWAPGFGKPRYPEIYGPSGANDADLSAELEARRRQIVTQVQASLDRMSAREKRLIILEGMPWTAPPSHAKDMQSEIRGVVLARLVFEEHFPKYYFDYVAASVTGLGPVPPAREWFAKTRPEVFGDPDWGWGAELHTIPERPYKGSNDHSYRENAAVAGLRLRGTGGRGVEAAARVGTETPGATRWVKTGLFVGVEAENGVAVRLTVCEGGRGYAVGDRISIPAGTVGNAAPITGEVTAIREETIGTVRRPDGTVDVERSYSQWDVDNGHWPRCFRRDKIHLNRVGAEYLSLLVAAFIDEKAWCSPDDPTRSRKGISMSNQDQPAQHAAHRSAVEERAAWAIEQRRGKSVDPNAKFGAAVALARLALNPDDDAVIDSITHFYDKLPDGSDGQQFSYPGVAWVLGRYWDKFTPAQRDHLKARLKGFSDLLGHGTENHAIMKGAAAYLFAQYWPDETGWVRGTMTSAQLGDTAREHMVATMRSLYDKGYVENLSHNYLPVHLYPYYVLYDCATDPEMKSAADAALHFHVTNMAANHFEGVTIPPAQRDYPTTTWNTYTYEPGKRHAGHLIHWLYWADAQNWTPSEIDGSDGNFVVYAALSSWRPPAAVGSLARGQTAPYELTASASAFGFWGTGTPAEFLRYVYRDKLYAMGSGHVYRYTPGGFYGSYTAFRLIFKSPDRFNFIECYHPYWRSNDRAWTGTNSPFEQWAQHESSAIVLFNIPTADPWVGRGRPSWQALRDAHSHDLIKEALVRYPKSIDQKTEADGWIFLRKGDVYIAIRPLNAYTIDADYAPAGPFDVVVSPGAKNAVVFDIATKEEFATFEGFQVAVLENLPVVDWDELSVAYASVKGDTLKATWNPPTYDVPEARENDPGAERVVVRPDIEVNGEVVPIDRDFIEGRAVMKSPSVELVERVLRLKTPTGGLVVDWRGDVPKFSNQ